MTAFVTSAVLEICHLGIEFGDLKAIEDFNIAVGPTENCGQIGPNGAGTTTVHPPRPFPGAKTLPDLFTKP